MRPFTQDALSRSFSTLRSSLTVACAVLAISSAGATAAPTKTLGFVVTDFSPATGEGYKVDCPDGRPLTAREIYLKYAKLTPAMRAYLKKEENIESLVALAVKGRHAEDLCRYPEAVQFPHPLHHIAAGSTVAPGFDLDEGGTHPPTCEHTEFKDESGKLGIDNQLFRLMGCSTFFNTSGFADLTDRTFISGGANYVFEISGVTDGKNDSVEVKFYLSNDTNLTDGQARILPDQSIRVFDEPQAPKNVFHGTMIDGVLRSADGGEFNLPFAIEFNAHQVVIRDVRLRLELKKDGSVEGLMGGYRDVNNWFQFFQRVASPSVDVYGLSCPGWIAQAWNLADGYPDPKTGKCTALSMAQRIRAIPAFVIHGRRDPSAPQQATSGYAK